MVKRTGEIVMGIIGVVLSALFAIMGFFLNANSDEIRNSVEQEFSNDPTLTAEDTNYILQMMDSMGPFLIGLGLISSILGLIAVLLIKGNKKPIVSGILFILAALVVGLGTVGIGFLPGILFLIAGIMSFVRKSKEPVTMG
jgi:flagellar motor component MotA